MSHPKQLLSGSWPDTAYRNQHGQIVLGGVSVAALAREFGTPLYVFDEDTLRNRARRVRDTFRAAYENSRIVYAGKAYLSPSLMRILLDEGIGLDVVSGGELFVGLASGVNSANIVYHGNNKCRQELAEAVAAGVGFIVVDNDHEISLLRSVVQEHDREATVVLRLNPGVDPHTHHKMRTGASDSKFGFPVWDGQADRAVDAINCLGGLRLAGYHAHVGSQIFDAELVATTLGVIMNFAERQFVRHGVWPEVVIPGGGFGVADDASGNDVSLDDWAASAASAIRQACEPHDRRRPTLIVEPGRAIIGPAGVAVYTVGARKEITGVRTYVSIDGGMADNIRPALYGACYSAALANRPGADGDVETVTVAGKYCESGDILIADIPLPRLAPGDLLAVPMAGAYCLSMASNYNLSPRPAVVVVRDGEAQLIRRRETYDDLLRTEVIGSIAGAVR